MGTAFAGLSLIVQSLWELLRFDLMLRLRGFRQALSTAGEPPVRIANCDSSLENRICEAMNLAVCLYWKRTLCLQRSVATARLLRSRGVHATLVIGCRSEPFLSHAWVEMDGRAINDSPAYQRLLCVLERI